MSTPTIRSENVVRRRRNINYKLDIRKVVEYLINTNIKIEKYHYCIDEKKNIDIPKEMEMSLAPDMKRIVLKQGRKTKSIEVKSIESFQFGPFQTRLWSLRRQINLMDNYDLKHKSPFFAWECLTINSCKK